MLRIKRLDIFILRTFLPLFAMTFCIVLFVVLMQFLWKYIDDLVGKGLGIDVLAELFFYASVSMVPMALPLAILLASLMTFGNLGEKFELTAMKASGISLLRVMAPLIVLVAGISVGDFYFQNDVLPKAQVKMWTLLFSVRQKSPEVEIPEGVYYDQIPGYNIYVEHKNQDTGMLYNVIIYDVGIGGSNSIIIRADSARLAFTKEMEHLYLRLWQGEQFENLREATSLDQNVPFRRENFQDKEILIPFDANFNRLDEEGLRRQYVGKNIGELRFAMDSIGERIDSMGTLYARDISLRSVMGIRVNTDPATGEPLPYEAVAMPAKPVSLDSLLVGLSDEDKANVYNTALSELTMKRQQIEFQSQSMLEEKKSLRRHEIEMLKKYTLSLACLIFFFIGAPLGAIIRKGGIGTPLILSIILFIIYYIIDNTGYKLARDGRWIVWVGIWTSTFIMAPLGIYVTIKAMNDSAVFDKDAYLALLRRWLGIRASRKVEFKEVIINEISTLEAMRRLQELRMEALRYLRSLKHQTYSRYWLQGYNMTRLAEISAMLDADVDYMRDCRNKLAVGKLLDYPVLRRLRLYHPATRRWVAWLCMLFVPIGVPVWLAGLKAQAGLRHDLREVVKVSSDIIDLLQNRNIEN